MAVAFKVIFNFVGFPFRRFMQRSCVIPKVRLEMLFEGSFESTITNSVGSPGHPKVVDDRMRQFMKHVIEPAPLQPDLYPFQSQFPMYPESNEPAHPLLRNFWRTLRRI